MKIQMTASSLLLILLAGFLSGVSSGQSRDRFHHAKPSPKVNYDSLLAAAAPLSGSAAGRALVEDCLSTYGGIGKLQSLKDFELTFEATSRFGNGSFSMVKSFQQGRHYRIDRRNEQRILSGNECWFQNEDQVLFLDKGRYRAELYSYLTLAMPLAIRTEHFQSIRYGERGEDSLGYIYLDKPDSLLMVVGIDKKDHLIKVIEGIIRQGDQQFVFINHFSEHQQHGGYRFPGQVITISMGLEVSRAKLTNVVVNQGFEARYFMPRERPESGDDI